MDIEYWQSKDYLTFVLLHMAFADNELTMAELYHMASRLGPDRVVAMRAYIENLDYKKQQKIIKRHRDKFYPGAFGKQSLISEICELCEADGNFSKMEKVVLKQLEDVI